MRAALATLLALALLAAPAAAQPGKLSKTRAHAKAQRLLGHDQIAYMFDVQLIQDWTLEPSQDCGRLSPRSVRCAFAVTMSDGRVCGATLTMTRWRAQGDQPAYIGWILSVDPLALRCDQRAARQADAGRPRRGIQDWLG